MARSLSSLERSSWLGREASQVNFAIVLRLSGRLPVHALPAALSRLRARHPILFVRLVEDGKGQLYLTDQGVPDLPYRVFRRCSDPGWVRVVQEELSQPFSYRTGPLARLVLLERPVQAEQPEAWDVVLVCDHGISDGYSAIYLARDLLTYLCENRPDPSPLPLPPDIWGLIPASYERSLPVRVKLLLFKTYFQHYLRSHPAGARPAVRNARSLPAPAATFPPLYGLVHRTLGPELTSTLVERCRSQGVTVQAALCAACGKALQSDGWVKRNSHPMASVPISLRSRLPEEYRETTGLYISTAVIPIATLPGKTPAVTEFWDAARQVKKDLDRAAAGEGLWMGPLMMKTIFQAVRKEDQFEQVSEFVKRQIHYDLSITNLGRISIPARYGEVQVEDILGPIVNSYEGEKTLGVCTFQGQMQLVFTYWTSELAPQQAEGLVDSALAALLDAVKIQPAAYATSFPKQPPPPPAE